MKKLLIILVLVSIKSWAQYNIVPYGNRINLVPVKQKELDGLGVISNAPVQFEEVLDPVTNKKVKKAYIWIRNCGNVYIKDDKILTLKEGTRINYRQGSESCSVQSWSRF